MNDELIEKELWAAHKLIPSDVIQTPEGYDEEYFFECMEKHQYLAAMEELDDVIVENRSPGKEFWLHLVEVAKLLNHGHIERYRSILRSTT